MKRKDLKVIIVALISLLFAASCGQKGVMTLNATGEDISLYEKGFNKYFNVTAIDASQYGYNYAVGPSRYIVNVTNSEIPPSESNIAFVINVSDNGSTVNVEIVYTVGASAENPAVVNPVFLSGVATVSKRLSFVPEETGDKIKRAKQVATFINNALKDIEK